MLLSNVTIVIPAYNEARRLPSLLAAFRPYLLSEPGLRLSIVDDGSTLEHYQVIEALVAECRASGLIHVELHRLPTNAGKGAALAYGFRQAKTPLVGFLDADGSVSAAECMRLAAHAAAAPEIDAVLASRVKMLGMTVERRMTRHLMGRVFATCVSTLFAIPVYDSQCGCKIFRREVVEPLLGLVHSQGWLWDTQLLILLYKGRHQVIEVPVSWYDVPGSKVSLLLDPLRMLRELLVFRRHLQLEESSALSLRPQSLLPGSSKTL